MAQLPIRLEKEPLIEALFELRFSSESSVSGLFPGFLYSKLSNVAPIEELGAAQIPKAIRDADPNLRYAQTNSLNWEDFVINIGDRSIAIRCPYPYPGWASFRTAISSILGHFVNMGISYTLERCSLKYVDIIPSEDPKEQISFANFSLMIADHKLEQEVFHVRVEIQSGDCVNVIQIASHALASIKNSKTKEMIKKEGLVVDIDTIANVNNGNFSPEDITKNLLKKLDEMHQVNKEFFFKALKYETIQSLKPVYE
jgi:uncharacterized protein (TIGR04255 family)